MLDFSVLTWSINNRVSKAARAGVGAIAGSAAGAAVAAGVVAGVAPEATSGGRKSRMDIDGSAGPRVALSTGVRS